MSLNSRLTFAVAAGLIVLLGSVLRIYGASGNLWLDEISTLTLVGRMHDPFAPFLLAHDNNHILNSLYIYFVGVDASPLFQRGFSVVLGVATIMAAGLALADRGRIAILLAMGLFAIAFPMVNYGSEARGYAGLILCTVLAINFLDKQLRVGGQRWQLAVAIFFGLLFHMTMVGTAAMLAVYTLLDRWNETRRFIPAARRTLWIFAPAAGLALVVAIDLLVARIETHKFGYGSLTPFSIYYFTYGYGGMIMSTIGSPGRAGSPCGIFVAAVAATLCFGLRKPGDKRPGIYLALIVALPLVFFVCRVPNAQINRYYLTSGVAFLMCLADLAVLAWQKDVSNRKFIALALLAFIVQTSLSLRMFLTIGRSNYPHMLALMTADGPTIYSGTNNDFLDTSEVDFYAKRQHVTATYVPVEDYCQTPTPWLTVATEPQSPLPPAPLDWGPPQCRFHFELVQAFPAWGMSGLTVTLYRRAN